MSEEKAINDIMSSHFYITIHYIFLVVSKRFGPVSHPFQGIFKIRESGAARFEDSLHHLWARDYVENVRQTSSAMLPTLGALQLWEEEMLGGTLSIPFGALEILGSTIQ